MSLTRSDSDVGTVSRLDSVRVRLGRASHRLAAARSVDASRWVEPPSAGAACFASLIAKHEWVEQERDGMARGWTVQIFLEVI